MFKILIASVLIFQTSVYSLKYTPVSGENQVSLSSLQGKKILFVNIATGSPYAAQLGELEQLRQQHADSLIIIAFPSNSFGHEARSNAEIKQFCEASYNTHFILTKKSSVKGADIHPVFNWLTKKNENGMLDGQVLGDFHKYLVNEEGVLIGEFSPKVSPLSAEIKKAISSN